MAHEPSTPPWNRNLDIGTMVRYLPIVLVGKILVRKVLLNTVADFQIPLALELQKGSNRKLCIPMV